MIDPRAPLALRSLRALALPSVIAAALAAPSSACTHAGPAPGPTVAAAASSSAPRCEGSLAPTDAFARRGVDGTFVLRDEADGCVRATDPALADAQLLPASTFKIPNALIGLETGVITGEHHLFKWDGVTRDLADWNQDLELGGALKASCVPCFQQVARAIGPDRMRDFLHRFGYGNEDLGGPIDKFWLTGGPLRISPLQQVDFVHRALSYALPVHREHVDLVFRLLEIERRGDAIWRGKTGLASQDGRSVGWLVGAVERGPRRWIYATLVRGRDEYLDKIKPIRKEIAAELLEREGVLPR